jgi:ferritin-like metal-binding protein YciE
MRNLFLYLNDALAMENAALEQLQHHLEETKEQQDRLRKIITKLGGTPTKEQAGLPILTSPEPILKTMKNIVSTAEREIRNQNRIPLLKIEK